MKLPEKIVPIFEKVKKAFSLEGTFVQKRFKRPLLTLTFSLTGLGLGFLWLYKKAAIYFPEYTFTRQIQTVDVVIAEFGTFHPYIYIEGTVSPAEEIPLKPKVHGSIDTLNPNFQAGGLFREGEVAFTIETMRYERNLAMSQIRLEDTENALSLERAKQLKARAEYEKSDKALPPHEEALVLREPEIAALTQRLQSARSAVRLAHENLDHTSVRVPFDAQIIRTEVRPGAWVNERSPTAYIANTKHFHLRVPLTEAQLKYIPQPSSDAQDIRVKIAPKAPVSDGATARTGTIHSTNEAFDTPDVPFTLRIAIEDPLSLQPEASNLSKMQLGEKWEAMIRGRAIEDVVRIPRGNLRMGDAIWVLSPKSRLELRAPDILFKCSKYIYITSGLSEGEMVITSDISRPELRMRLRKTDQETEQNKAIQVDEELVVTPETTKK